MVYIYIGLFVFVLYVYSLLFCFVSYIGVVMILKLTPEMPEQAQQLNRAGKAVHFSIDSQASVPH